MKKVRGLIWGAIIIVLGVIWGLNETGRFNIDILFDGWWTLFIIIPSLIGLVTDKNKTGSLIGLAVGGTLLLGHYVDLEKYENFFMPAIVVLVGFIVIFNTLTKKKITAPEDFSQTVVNSEAQPINNDTTKKYYATFSGENIVFNNDFVGGDFVATFGGMKIDLRSANIQNGAVINTNATFGGIDILLPADVSAVIKSNSVFGGVSDKSNKSLPPEFTTIFINSSNIFGGTEVK